MERLDATDPRRIGPYTLLGRLGAGGMGAVYLGRSSGGRTVAVKVVRPELAGDAEFRRRFRAEVSAAKAVSGAFTAPVVDADPEAGTPWMATAFVAGVALSDAVSSRGPLPEPSLRMLAAGVAEALADIHRAKLIHRDLKPSNILLAPDGPHVIDFGITRAMDGSAPLTATGSVVGSPGYMSPEQVLGHPVGPESDMFSLGATLVYAATARGAYGEGAPQALLYRVASGEPDPATLAAIPASLRDAVAACLHKEPARRPTPRQLADYIDQLTPIAVGGSWLPPTLTADVVAAGAVVTSDSATFDTGGGPAYPATAGTADLVGTVAHAGGIPTPPHHNAGVAPMAPTEALARTGGAGRRNILIAGGGAVVLAGAGVGIALASGGDGKPNPPNPTKPTNTTPTTPDSSTTGPTTGPTTAPTTAPTTTLPPAAGSVGTLAGPDAKAAWTATLSGTGAAMGLSGKTPIVLGEQNIQALDPATGKPVWPKPVPVQDGKMKVVGGTVYATGDLVTDTKATVGVFAIDAATGNVTWSFPLPEHWIPSGVRGELNGVVYADGADLSSSRSSYLLAVDTKAHKEMWRLVGAGAKGPGAIYVPATGDKIFNGVTVDENTFSGQVQSLDAKTGTKGWAVDVKSVANFTNGSTPFAMASGSLVYAGDQAYGIDPATGKQHWAFTPTGIDTTLGWPGVSPDGGLVVFTGSSHVYAVDAKTGQQKWKTALPDNSTQVIRGIEEGTPQIADGNVYVTDSKFTLWALDAGTGATRWKYSFPVQMQWVAGGGFVYAVYGSALVAIKASGQ